jgi:hypothetical protein
MKLKTDRSLMVYLRSSNVLNARKFVAVVTQSSVISELSLLQNFFPYRVKGKVVPVLN